MMTVRNVFSFDSSSDTLTFLHTQNTPPETILKNANKTQKKHINTDKNPFLIQQNPKTTPFFLHSSFAPPSL
jgi:hypothetical protein